MEAYRVSAASYYRAICIPQGAFILREYSKLEAILLGKSSFLIHRLMKLVTILTISDRKNLHVKLEAFSGAVGPHRSL